MSSFADRKLDVSGKCSLWPGSSKLQLHIVGVDGSDLLRGELRSSRLTARVLQRGRTGDLMRSGWASVHLMSERMRIVLQGSGLTGWLAQPLDVDSDLLDGPVWLLGVSGRSGPTYSAARNRLPGLPPLGEFLDPADWDGSDFFCPENWDSFLITARARVALRKARLRNISMECGSLEPLPGIG